CETEAETSRLGALGIAAPKGFEQLDSRRKARTRVAHLEREVGVDSDLNLDAALLSVLDGVRDQVRQDLETAIRIALDAIGGVAEIEVKCEAFVAGLARERREARLKLSGGREGSGQNGQAAGL